MSRVEGYNVKTDVYEGPLDLLLNLVEERKLFINDIALAEVADDFIAYVKSLEGFPVQNIANFILIASTLVLIKSKSLLPHLTLSEEEEGDIKELENRLRLYKRMRQLSNSVIQEEFGKNMMFFSQGTPQIEPIFSPDEHTTQKNLLDRIKTLIADLPLPHAIPEAVIDKIVSLEETIQNLVERVTSQMQTTFSDFSERDTAEKINIVVSFLAMLELVKQGIVDVTQSAQFEDIEIKKAHTE